MRQYIHSLAAGGCAAQHCACGRGGAPRSGDPLRRGRPPQGYPEGQQAGSGAAGGDQGEGPPPPEQLFWSGETFQRDGKTVYGQVRGAARRRPPCKRAKPLPSPRHRREKQIHPPGARSVRRRVPQRPHRPPEDRATFLLTEGVAQGPRRHAFLQGRPLPPARRGRPGGVGGRGAGGARLLRAGKCGRRG